jgi:hypothetical protein
MGLSGEWMAIGFSLGLCAATVGFSGLFDGKEGEIRVFLLRLRRIYKNILHVNQKVLVFHTSRLE